MLSVELLDKLPSLTGSMITRWGQGAGLGNDARSLLTFFSRSPLMKTWINSMHILKSTKMLARLVSLMSTPNPCMLDLGSLVLSHGLCKMPSNLISTKSLNVSLFNNEIWAVHSRDSKRIQVFEAKKFYPSFMGWQQGEFVLPKGVPS